MLTIVKRDGKLVERLYKEGTTVKAVCQISKIDEKYNYTNVAIQKVFFMSNNIEYGFDHVWLQARDYSKCKELKTMEEGAWIEIEFTFYQYRDKVNKNRAGRMMHGLTINKVTLLDAREAERTYNPKFSGLKNVKFNNNFNSAINWLY